MNVHCLLYRAIRYELVELSGNDEGMQFEVDAPSGTIDANSSTSIGVRMVPTVVGELGSVLKFRILGDTSSPPLEVECGCICEGPVVSVLPQVLKWGKHKMLTGALILSLSAPVVCLFWPIPFFFAL